MEPLPPPPTDDGETLGDEDEDEGDDRDEEGTSLDGRRPSMWHPESHGFTLKPRTTVAAALQFSPRFTAASRLLGSRRAAAWRHPGSCLSLRAWHHGRQVYATDGDMIIWAAYGFLSGIASLQLPEYAVAVRVLLVP